MGYVLLSLVERNHSGRCRLSLVSNAEDPMPWRVVRRVLVDDEREEEEETRRSTSNERCLITSQINTTSFSSLSSTMLIDARRPCIRKRSTYLRRKPTKTLRCLAFRFFRRRSLVRVLLYLLIIFDECCCFALNIVVDDIVRTNVVPAHRTMYLIDEVSAVHSIDRSIVEHYLFW